MTEAHRRPNYITEYREFLKEARLTSLAATPQLMYLHMLDIANEAGWPEELNLSNVELCRRLGCSDESILRARRTLVKMGRLVYLGQRNRKPRYHIRYYSQAVDNPVDNPGEDGGEPGPQPSGEKTVEPAVERGVEPAVEQGVEQGVEQTGSPMENTGIAPDVKPGVEQAVEHAVEQGVENPVERAVDRPVEQGVENPVEPSQTETPKETPNETPGLLSSSSSSAGDAQGARERLWARLSAQLYPPTQAEEGLVAEWARDFDPAVVEDMLQLALKRGVRSYRYLEVGLARLRAQGITTLPAYRAREAAFAQSRERQGTAQKPGATRPVKEVAQHRYGAQRSYSAEQWEALVTDPFAEGITGAAEASEPTAQCRKSP